MDNRDNLRDVNESVIPENKINPSPNEHLDTIILSQKKNTLPDKNTIKNFFSVTFANLLYCLSAASIMYAIMKLIGPALENSYHIKQTLPSVFVLTLYELALLAVLMLIVIKARAVNDAVLLVILMAFFTIGTGLALSTISLTAPGICMFIGLNCVLIGIAKTYALKKHIKLKIPPLTFAGLTLILIWNFIASSWMARTYITNDCPDDIRRIQWLISWTILLLAAALILISAIRKSASEYLAEKQTNPFLTTSSMTWLYTLLMLAAACYHQYATGYMFHIDTAFGDYIPLVVVMSLMFVELLRSTGRKPSLAEFIILCVPILVIFYAMAQQQIATFKYSDSHLELITHPALAFAAMSIAACAIACLHKVTKLFYISTVYALFVLLTIGYNRGDITDLNWELFGTGLFIIAMAYGIHKKEPLACFAAVMILASGLGLSGRLDTFANSTGLTQIGLSAAIAGLGNLIIVIVFGLKTHKAITILAALCIAAAAFDILPKNLNTKDLIVTITLMICAVTLYLRTKNLAVIPILILPIIPRGYLMWQQMSTWAFVILSFILLFAGGAISLLTNKKTTTDTNPD